MTTYDAQIIADSLSPDGVRLTTFYTVWPHAVHKDFMTHRVLGRNFESFRAQPTEKVIAAIRESPFMPDVFAKRVAGMGQGADMDQDMQATIRRLWQEQIENACRLGDLLVENELAKQQANFLLQDFAWITGVVTATEWDNFFALRTELRADGTPVARPEVYKTAKLMRDLYEASEPRQLEPYQWHLPFVELGDQMQSGIDWSTVSAGRCARISYGYYLDADRTQTLWDEEPQKGVDRAERLKGNGHMSPFEHPARPMVGADLQDELLCEKIMVPASVLTSPGPRGLDSAWCGNLRGWVPVRKLIPHEDNYAELQKFATVA
jgi:hypothetical protein